MKAIASFFAVFCIILCASAETPAVMFDDAFSLAIPEGWLECETEDETDDTIPVACLTNGQTTLTIMKEPIPDRNTDINTYALYLQENGYPEAFVSAFSSEENVPQFVLFSAPESSVAFCSTIIHEKGIYTFSFSPVAADEEYGQTILDMMATFAITEITGAE